MFAWWTYVHELQYPSEPCPWIGHLRVLIRSIGNMLMLELCCLLPCWHCFYLCELRKGNKEDNIQGSYVTGQPKTSKLQQMNKQGADIVHRVINALLARVVMHCFTLVWTWRRWAYCWWTVGILPNSLNIYQVTRHVVGSVERALWNALCHKTVDELNESVKWLGKHVFLGKQKKVCSRTWETCPTPTHRFQL